MKTLKKIKKSLIAFLLAVVLVVPMAACDKGGAAGSAALKDVEFWGTYSSESILQDLHGVYDDFKFEAAIDLTVVGGEEEAGKIIMTTGEKPIAAFDAEITDLKSGDNVLKKENIDVLQSLYTYLGAREFYKYEGYFPDGLAPVAGAKAIGENKVPAKSNQGIYVSFRVPVGQPAGTYTGTLVITIGGEKKDIPVKVTVLDTTLTEETHYWSSFSLGWGHWRGELDTTFDMTKKYIEALKQHRFGPNVVMNQYSKEKPSELAWFYNWAIEYCSDPAAVSFGNDALETKAVESMTIVYPDGSTHTYPDAKTLAADPDATCPSYDEAKIKRVYGDFFRTAIQHYLETGEEVDPLAKTFSKGIDEPDLRNATWGVPYYAYSVHHAKEELAKELYADASIPQSVKETEYFARMIESMKNVHHVVTTWASQPTREEGGLWDKEVMDMHYCPHYNDAVSNGLRDSYRSVNKKGEMWWYGCDTPSAPYPSYHLGNHALSERVQGWMSADYGVIGNLVWSTNLYKVANGDGTNYMEDYYDQAMRSRSIPGEGWLFNPGKMYGVDGPLATLRLKEFKNGIEEWELIRKIKLLYEERGYSETSIMNTLYTTMYSQSRIYDTLSCKIVQDARTTMLEMLLLAESDANVLITDYSNVRGKVVYEVFVQDGYTLGSSADDDVVVSSKFKIEEKAVDGGTLYTIECQDESAFVLTAKQNDGSTRSISFGLETGSASFTPATDFYNAGTIKVDDKSGPAETLELALANAVALNPKEEVVENYVQLKMGDAADKSSGAPGQQSFIITDALCKKINNTVDKLQIELYYDGEEEIPVTFTYKGKRAIAAGSTSTLKKGVNLVTISGMKSLAWNNIGTIEYLLVRYGNDGDLARDNVYFMGITIYK